jgi:hypothetical protein
MKPNSSLKEKEEEKRKEKILVSTKNVDFGGILVSAPTWLLW